jgi:hypothetical protein
LNQRIRTKTITVAQLETLVGRLNHAAFVIPLSWHFLGRLYRRLKRRRRKDQGITLHRSEIDNLKLWTKFLSKARAEISLNLITHRRPAKLGLSDSCPYGLRGFSWSGRAWRIQIPTDSVLYGDDTVNNVLEFLAMAITLWLMVIECTHVGARHECLLALGDNTSAIGWLFRSSKLDHDSKYFTVVELIARQVVTLLLDSEHCLFGQHIWGKQNTVSDMLSYMMQQRGDGQTNPLAANEPTDEELTQRFHQYLPQVIPEAFEISTLPHKVLSFAVLALQTAEQSWTRLGKRRTRSATSPGGAGKDSATRPESIIPSSISFLSKGRSSSCAPFLPPTETLAGISQADFLATIRVPYQQRLCKLPQATWLRRSGTISNKVPFTSKTELSSFRRSEPSSGPTLTLTTRPDAKTPPRRL